jgi:predicted CXXCH cytochrome family protein
MLLAPLLVIALVTAVLAKKPHGDDVHRTDADCRTCHTADSAALNQNRDAAEAALVSNLETRCAACHGDEGPSHRTGIPAVRSVPATLPLATNGTIGCATCHFMHGESNTFGDFLRVDNRHGALCLSCHELSELH